MSAPEPFSAPLSEAEKRLVLELLPRALNEAGIALALGAPNAQVVARVAQVLSVLEAEERVYRVAPEVWRAV